MDEFFTGPGETVRRPDELLTAIRVVVPPPERVFRFRKAGTRPSMECSVVTVGVAFTPADGNGRSGAGSRAAGAEDADAIINHMVRTYSGVGKRTAERLVEEFGASVFDVIDANPERLSAVLSERRAQAVVAARQAERSAGLE